MDPINIGWHPRYTEVVDAMTPDDFQKLIDSIHLKTGSRPKWVQLTNEECATLSADPRFIGPHNATAAAFSFNGVGIRLLFDFPGEDRIQ